MNSLLLALFLAQANMGLTIPTPGVTPGPTYATEISNDLVIIDAHNHTAGNGVQVPTAGLNINANLSFNGFGATNFNSCTGTACGVPNPTSVLVVNDGGGILSPSYSYQSNADPTNPVATPISIQDVGDFDSMVPHSVFNRDWQTICAGVGAPIGTSASGAPAIGNLYIDAINSDPSGISRPSAYGARFSVPPGTTSVALNVNMMDGGTTGTVSIGFSTTEPSCGNPTGQQLIVSPNNTMTTYTKTLAVTPPVLNIAQIALSIPAWGTSGIGSPVIGTVQVKPIGATGLFASDFYRVGATASNSWYNTRDEHFFYDFAFTPNTGSELVFDTDSTQMSVEYEYDNTDVTIPQFNQSVFVNGRPWAVVPVTGAGGNYYGQFVNVPLPSGMKRVEVVSGSYVDRQTTGLIGGDNRRGAAVQAVYFPSNSTTYIIPPPSAAARVLEVYGDSLGMGYYSATPLQQGWFQLLRRWFPGQVVLEAWSTRSLYFDVGVSPGSLGFNAQSMQTLVSILSRPRPTDIWIEMGTNDYLHPNWSAAQYGVAYAALLDAVHQRNPEAQIYAQTLTITNSESAPNGVGSTPPNYRTQQSNACNARTWCILIDGTTMFPASYLQDSVHPGGDGEVVYGQSVLAALEANPPTASAPINWSSNFPNGVNITGPEVISGTLNADAGYFGNITINGTCTGPGCGGGGITNPYLGTFIADAGNFGSVTSDAGYYATLIAINGIDGTLTLDGGSISQSAASTPLTITGNAPATGSNGIIANTGPTTLTTGNIEQFQNNSVIKGSIDFAGKFLSLPGDFFASGANTVTLKGAIAATGIGAIIDNTIDVTGTGYISQFSTAGTPQFAITGRGHLIPLSTAPTVGSFASGYGTVSGPTVTGGDASFKVSFTTGTATAITYGTALMVVTLNQAYAAAGAANSFAAYSSAPAAGGADQAGLYAVFTAGNQITIYAGSGSAATSFIPASAHAYSISVITMGAGSSS